MRVKGFVVALLAAGLTFLGALPAAAQEEEARATLWYINGVPGLPVDVYWNETLRIPAFQPGTISDPVTPRAHTGTQYCRPVGAPADGPVIAQGEFELAPNSNVTTIMHLNTAGEPIMSGFVNDISGIRAGQGRLTVRHTAAAPAMNVSVEGGPVLRGISAGREVSAAVPAGAFDITVALASSDETVIQPVKVEVPAGGQTVLYPIGSDREGTLDLLVQTITGNAEAPAGVPSGGGAAASPALPPWMTGAIAIAALVTVASAVRLSRSRA
jgi:uncharacterized protein DUF4397